MRLLYTLLLVFMTIFAQAQAIKGIISDKSGNPIDFVTVTVNKSTIHTHTDEFGRYTLTDVKMEIPYILHICYMKLIGQSSTQDK
jgi:hypothetical protein